MLGPAAPAEWLWGWAGLTHLQHIPGTEAAVGLNVACSSSQGQMVLLTGPGASACGGGSEGTVWFMSRPYLVERESLGLQWCGWDLDLIVQKVE